MQIINPSMQCRVEALGFCAVFEILSTVCLNFLSTVFATGRKKPSFDPVPTGGSRS